jgi:hypothetical protein
MLTALALAGGPGDRKLLESKLRQPELKVAAAEALGIHGGLESVAPLLQLLEEKEESVRLAAARSLYMLAGAGPTETVDVPPDEEEPIEDATTSAPSGRPGAVPAHAAKVTKVSTGAPAWREWWEAHRASFEPGLRHRRGKPFALGRCIADLESPGRTLAIRRRTQWELEIRSGQRFPFEPDAFVVRQKEGLAAWQAWWKENSARFPAGTWPFAGGAAV